MVSRSGLCLTFGSLADRTLSLFSLYRANIKTRAIREQNPASFPGTAKLTLLISTGYNPRA